MQQTVRNQWQEITIILQILAQSPQEILKSPHPRVRPLVMAPKRRLSWILALRNLVRFQSQRVSSYLSVCVYLLANGLLQKIRSSYPWGKQSYRCQFGVQKSSKRREFCSKPQAPDPTNVKRGEDSLAAKGKTWSQMIPSVASCFGSCVEGTALNFIFSKPIFADMKWSDL